MTQDILNELKKDLKEKEIGYNRNSIPSRYNTEQNYKKRYKGREILELIQNAEDANASELVFALNKEKQKIIISNNGENFSLNGYRSLLYPNISSKPKGVFIGQKGLGFRALINWAKEISILSNNLKITFSEEISNRLLDSLKKNYPEMKDITNMEFLSIPKIEEIQNYSTGVTIELVYNEKIDFEQQFSTIDQECFFFLKNLKSIKTQSFSINKADLDNIVIKEITEKLPDIYYEKEELENKAKRELSYNIKLVWNPSKNYKDFPLYTYFRTNVKIGSPILIHAGFDLSDDRNNIEITKRNKFLVEEICKLIEKLIEEIIIKTNDWSAYRLLSHQIHCEYGSMFEKIQNCFEYCKKHMPIYPSIDGKMKNNNEIIILDNEVTEFIISLKKQYPNIKYHDFNDVAVPVYDSDIKLSINTSKYYQIFNKLSEKIPADDIASRTRLVKLFHQYANSYCIKKPAIFIDNNKEIIPEDDEVFSYSDLSFDEKLVPSFCKYTTINSNLYRKLINEKILTTDEIESCINTIYPSSYTNIFLILVDYLSEDTNELQKKEIYSNLFKMYKQYENEIEIPSDYLIPILCDDGKYYSENVVFNYGFNANDKILEIIESFIHQNDNIHCLAKKEYWSFLNATDVELKNFFKFIKVFDSIEYESINSDAQLFINSLSKEDIIKLAILDNNFYEFIKLDNELTREIKSRKFFSDYVINTKKINFLNNDLLDKSAIKKCTNDETKINNILKSLGAQDTIETVSPERFNVLIKNLPIWDQDGEFAGTIYDQAFKNEVQIRGQVDYYSKDKAAYVSNKELYYYDNKCLPASKLKEFPTIDLGRRKGHDKVSKYFNIKSIEDYKVKLVGKPSIDINLTNEFINDFKRFYPLILAYRFCSTTNPLGDDMRKEQTNTLKNIDVKICRELIYTFNNTLNKEVLEDFDFINSEGVFYFKIPDECQTIDDIREHKKELYDFISEMLLMTFKLAENNSYIKDTAVQTYIFNDLMFSTSRFEDDNDRTILREAEEYLQIRNPREEFWKHIHKLKNIEEDYEIWEQKQKTKKSFSTLDYTQFNDDMAAIFDEEDVSISIKDFFKDYPYKNAINFSEYNKEQFKNLFNYRVKKDLEKYIWYQCNKKSDNQPKFQERRNAIHWENISYLFNVCNYLIDDFEKELWLKLREKNYDKDKISEIINSNNIDFEIIYKNNLNNFTNEEIDIIKQFANINSLMYFENTYDKIKSCLNEYKEKRENNANKLQDTLSQDYSTSEWQDIAFSAIKREQLFEKNDISNKHHQRTSFSSIERAKNDIEKGHLIEKIALDYLQNSTKYIDAIDVSDRGLGYDIECIEKATKTLIYIEVKSFEKDFFEITENEYNMWKNNKNIYKFLLIKINTKERILIDGELLETQMIITPNKYKCKLR